MATPSKEARFRDYDSTERGTLCILYDDYGEGEYLGQVYATGRGWVWEDADADYEDDDDPGRGEEDSRREAKAALRKYLKAEGVLS